MPTSFSPRQVASGLLLLVLAKSLLIALIISPSYGADGPGYLKYISVMVDPSDPEDFWDIRGTTPVYPLFAYTTYWLAGESGYGVVVAQIILLALVAPAIYIALYRASPLAALLSGLLLALDPQTGLLAQQIATEGLYIPLLGLGLAGLLYQYQRLSPAWIIYTLGLLLGVGALTRPVGVFLIVPYAVFYLLLSRSPKRMLFLILGYLTILLALAGLNSWRFDYFAPYNTGGFYLATRLFGVGDLYDHRNGPQSERLYYLAGYCYLDLDQNDENLVVTRYLRQCLYYRHQMTFDEISQLYQAVYSEATQAQPSAFAVTMGQQLARYVWQSSDPSDLAGARALQADCTSDPEQWYSPSAVFCPTSPMPLARLQTGLFIVILAFSLLTRVLNFGLAGLVIGQQPPLIRWAWLCCLGLFAYHAVVTAAAGTILSRYITVTNPYTLIVLGIGLAGCLNWLRALPKR